MRAKRLIIFSTEAVTHPLNLGGVGRQSCGQSSGAVPVIIKPSDLLAQHGVETQPP